MIRTFRFSCWLVLLLAITSFYTTSYGQSITSASGIVKDSISGEVLPYVSILFKNSTIGAMTDDNGAFSLQNSKGYTESYNVYKSTNANLGNTTVEVK